MGLVSHPLRLAPLDVGGRSGIATAVTMKAESGLLPRQILMD